MKQMLIAPQGRVWAAFVWAARMIPIVRADSLAPLERVYPTLLAQIHVPPLIAMRQLRHATHLMEVAIRRMVLVLRMTNAAKYTTAVFLESVLDVRSMVIADPINVVFYRLVYCSNEDKAL